MAELKFKTRGMMSPQGMPRVYFSCHPKDFERYFEKISDDILKKQNCAIFYLDSTASYSEEELFHDLGQMQLFVMPVTSNLLFDPNRAIDSEFAFAMEKHIPVLPIMQENGLEEHFNKKCGDLQFLDPNSGDLTAISYDEKLEKYLSSVLVGDELAAKVRAAFDAYVFLSYRKKDRKYAQELMRLIHKNDFCRDIAIWYDEFLTPGENFNDSIEDALNKSGLFVMAVTPNLVNEPNYIMSTEYPMAKEKNKPILPAELVETDRKLLEECYKDIPVCTDAHNESALSDSLLKAVQAMAKRENDSSPEHNFFIGLAYLSGIDVEVDHERAVSLITSAAEAGLPEAMKKLVTMYRNGEGVKRDYEKAILWQENYVFRFKRIYEKTGKINDGYKFLDEIWGLGDFCKELWNTQKAIEYYKIMNETSYNLVEKTGAHQAKRYLSVSYNKLGDFTHSEARYLLVHNYDKYETTRLEAREYYLKGLNILLSLKESGVFGFNRDLFVSYYKLGQVEFENGRDNGEQYFLKAVEVSKAFVEKNGDFRASKDLADTYCYLGEIYKNPYDEESNNKAIDYYKKAIEIRKCLVEKSNAVQKREDLAQSYILIGDAYSNFDETKQKAQDYYLKSFEIRKQLEQETGALNEKEALLQCCAHLAEIAYFSQNENDLKFYVDLSLKLIDQISEFAVFPDDRERLAHLIDKTADEFKRTENFVEAEKLYLKSLGIRIQLREETATHISQNGIYWSYKNLYYSAFKSVNLKKSREYLLEFLKFSESLEDEGFALEIKREVFNCLKDLGSYAKYNIQDNSMAKDFLIEALEFGTQLAEMSGEKEDKGNLAKVYEELALLDRDNPDIEYLRKACEFYPCYLENIENFMLKTRHERNYNYLKSILENYS
ncbi:MAG: TIR domain-containing protein [Clostridia bacterium]|nr:TIR domain-containing protein [Clostridia bacterium]